MAVLLLFAAPMLQAKESRLALVIGNASYANSPLANPLNDAKDMVSTLESLDFEVIVAFDTDRREMSEKIRTFGKKLKKNKGVGFFYYAGHGVQYGNENYLVPIDAPVQEADEIPYESVEVDYVLAKMESAGNSLNILVLDACRNNPFPSASRSMSRGLAQVEAPGESLILYATAPGMVAEDGQGRNGTFTGHLLKYMKEPNLDLNQIVQRTSRAVIDATDGRQRPFRSSSITKDFFLNPQEKKIESTAESTAKLDMQFWQSVEKGNTAADYEAYLKGFPEGRFTALAQIRLDRILSNADQATQSGPILNPKPTENTEDSQVLAYVEPGQDSTVKNPRPSPGKVETRGKFIVDVQPVDARIRIMNISEKYFPGVQLDYGKQYDVYITHPGYKPFRETISFSSETSYLNIVLESARVAPTGTPNFVTVNGTVFRMGCSEGDRRCKNHEKPAREVNVASFKISTTEITVKQFQKFVTETQYVTDAERSAGGFKGCYIWSDKKGISRSNGTWNWSVSNNWRDPGYAQKDDFPVTCVSWNDANEYVKWLSRVEGKSYRLPSEAEWEFAARGGNNAVFSYGKAEESCNFANAADSTVSPTGSNWSSRLKCSDGNWFSAPVANYQPNPFGLYDMHGNVWEWVSDNWAESLEDAPKDGSAYSAGEEGHKVLRGGAWNLASSYLRSSTRSRGIRASRAAMTGFRVVEEF